MPVTPPGIETSTINHHSCLSFPVAMDSQSKGSHSGGSSAGSHEPFFGTEFPTLRRNPDSKLALKESGGGGGSVGPPVPPKNVEKTTMMTSTEESVKRRQATDGVDLRHSRDSLAVSASVSSAVSVAKDTPGLPGHIPHLPGTACLLHQHCADDLHRGLRSHGGGNPGRLFSGNMTAEEMALVLEAAQALVDPPERFSSKSKSGHKFAPPCFAQNERFVENSWP